MVGRPDVRGAGEAPLGEERILGWFRSAGPTLVALSGGVDSAVVAALAHRADPARNRSATLVGPAVAPEEVERARSVARRIGIAHDLVPIDPLAVEEYRRNPANRCYFCRATEAAALQAFGHAHGIAHFVDGVHVDDLGDDRPGLRALAEAGFRHPLLEAGWGKVRIRSVARSLGLPNWDAPSDSCLASRVPHGTMIEAPMLERIARAEAFVRGLGYRRVRARLDGPGARLEVEPEAVGRLSADPDRSAVTEHLRALGFAHVTIDPRGYGTRANG